MDAAEQHNLRKHWKRRVCHLWEYGADHGQQRFIPTQMTASSVVTSSDILATSGNWGTTLNNGLGTGAHRLRQRNADTTLNLESHSREMQIDAPTRLVEDADDTLTVTAVDVRRIDWWHRDGHRNRNRRDPGRLLRFETFSLRTPARRKRRRPRSITTLFKVETTLSLPSLLQSALLVIGGDFCWLVEEAQTDIRNWPGLILIAFLIGQRIVRAIL